LTVAQIEKGFDMDPLFKQISSMFDAGSSKSLMVSLLGVTPDLNLSLDKDSSICPEVESGVVVVQSPEFTMAGCESMNLTNTPITNFLIDNQNHVPEYTLQRELFGDAQNDAGAGFGGEEADNSDYFEDNADEIDIVHELERSAMKTNFNFNRNLMNHFENISAFDNYNFFPTKAAQWAGSEFLPAQNARGSKGSKPGARKSIY
jgi:hypothetical protein